MTKLEYFSFEHLPPHLREVSRPFSELANKVYALRNQGADPDEVDKSLEALLIAKDAAVRSALYLGETSE